MVGFRVANTRPLTTESAPPLVVIENTQKAARGRLPGSLSPQSKAGDEVSIPLDILVVEVLEQSSALANHHQQTSPTVMVLFIDLQMLGEVADALGEQRNLDLGRARVRVVEPMFFNYRLRVFHAEVSFEGRKARTNVRPRL